MRSLPTIFALALTMATPAFAQVTVDLHALQALPDKPGNSRAERPEAPVVRSGPTTITRVAPASPPAASAPSLPDNVPDTASVPPISPPPLAENAVPPPAPPVSDKAATKAAQTVSGLRLTFGPGQSDLSPDSSASIKELTGSVPSNDSATFNVLAYSPGKSDDPSTARRVSLSRAMAVRSALVADGIPSARIFVRAMGDQFGDGPPDRVDISVLADNTASAR